MTIFISGVGPGEAGASSFYKYIEYLAIKNNVRTIYPYKHKAFRRLFSRNKIDAILYLIKINIKQILFTIKVLSLKRQNIIFSHPQGIGLLLTIFLIIRHKKINFYVLDNSYFCLESYNYHKIDGECLRCINFQKKPYKDCRSFPGIRLKSIHSIFMKFLYKNNSKIKFFFQNDIQLDLFKIHMNSENLNLKRLGLITSDIKQALNEYRNIKKKEIKLNENLIQDISSHPYIVFHGNDNEAKGCHIAYEIAKYLPEYKFIFPFSKPKKRISKNCIFYPCSWETGLKDLVINANCVLNTSMWSAPIEGALIKSILYNGILITAKTSKAFFNEIPEELRLIYESPNSIKNIRNKLNDKKELRNVKRGIQSWIVEYYKGTDLSELFVF